MEDLLRRLLERLELIGERNEELFDSEVRQKLGNAIVDGFVRTKETWIVPDEFGMFEPQADSEVKFAVSEFISAANAIAVNHGLTTFHDRLAAVQNGQVRTESGNDYEEFFGHSPPEFFDERGNVIRVH